MDNTDAIMDVVVVLPCMPATVTEVCMRINSASISALGIMGIRRSLAAINSGLSVDTADE